MKMDKIIKVKILGDGNCLFRCFSHFLYNHQNLHNEIRQNVIRNIFDQWDDYEPFVVGNSYYNNIITNDDYLQLMSSNGVYGTEIEIQSFAQLYNTYVVVHVNNSESTFTFGNNLNYKKLRLLLSGEIDSGHYDIVDYINSNTHTNFDKIDDIPDKVVEIKNSSDGNCLFKCFSHFLYNSDKFYNRIRQNVVNNIVEHWNDYKDYIMDKSPYIINVVNSDNYFRYMSKVGVYGTEIEIQSFTKLYDVYVSVYKKNTILSFGNDLSNFKLELLLSDENDKHYDIISYSNTNIRSHAKKLHYRSYNRKRQIQSETDYTILKKKRKLSDIDSTIILQSNSKNLNEKSKLLIMKNDTKVVKSKQTISLIDTSFFGDMQYVCEFCSAVYWKEEKKNHLVVTKEKLFYRHLVIMMKH